MFQKAIIILVSALLLAGPAATLAHSQSVDVNSIDELEKLRQQQQNPHARIYARASSLHDYSTAIYALHQLLLEDPDNGYLQDSLAFMYAVSGNSTSCLIWCAQCLEKRPESFFLLNLSGNLLESAGRPMDALSRFESLHKLTGSHYYRYKVSTLQYTLGRYGECLVNVEALLQDSTASREMVRMSWEENTREVPLPAALLNLRGNLELALNQESKARKSFREALKIDPEFDLARNNIRALDEKNRQRFDRGNDR